jgi:hypothetical protein
MRRPPVVLGMATITILALLLAVGLILFSVNPTQKDTQAGLQKAIMSQHAIICAQVQNTANAYRFRSLTPSGDVEPIRHFLTRMQAQQQTLRLARGSECKSAPNFPPVGLQVRRALHQINEILQHFEPKLRRPVSHRITSTDKQPGFPRDVSRPPNAGIDESGVPATLKPELAPSAPVQAQKGIPVKPSAPPPALTNPDMPEGPPAQAPESATEEGGTRVIEKPRVELPTAPIVVEIGVPKLEGLE